MENTTDRSKGQFAAQALSEISGLADAAEYRRRAVEILTAAGETVEAANRWVDQVEVRASEFRLALTFPARLDVDAIDREAGAWNRFLDFTFAFSQLGPVTNRARESYYWMLEVRREGAKLRYEVSFTPFGAFRGELEVISLFAEPGGEEVMSELLVRHDLVRFCCSAKQ